MADGFVNLEAKLAATKDQRASLFGTLRGGVKRDGFFANARRMLHEFHRFDQFIATEDVLTAEAVRVGALLDGVTLKRHSDYAAAGHEFALMEPRTGRGCKPGIDLAELHIRFGEGDALDLAHFGVKGKEQAELRFDGNFEGIFEARALPAINVVAFGCELHGFFFGECRSLGDGNSL